MKKYRFPAKERIIPAHQKVKEKNDTCWQLNANINSVFRLEIMHQQIYINIIFSQLCKWKNICWEIRDDYYPLFKISMATGESSAGIRNVQCFLINLIYTVGWWNAAKTTTRKTLPCSPSELLRCSQVPTWLLISYLSLEKSEAGLVELEEKPHAKGRQVGQGLHRHFV